MKKLFYTLALIATFSFLTTSCATIVGGSKYYAHVKVPEHPYARIEYKGQYIGNGSAMVKVKRTEAGNLSFTVKEDGYKQEEFQFNRKKYRTFALIGSAVLFTGMVGGVPIPWGVTVDMCTGALWKPDKNEKGVSKMDMKNYTYTLDYKGNKIEEISGK